MLATMGAAAVPWWRRLPTLGLSAFPAKSWYHALSTTLAAVLALYVAFELELDSPGSAATTVLIVSSPLPGMVLSKSVWRLVGTCVGTVVSVLLIAWFAQSPVAFLLALALWLGLCTFASALLRYFRAYAAVLAGYTLSIVALPAAEHPEQIFDLASNRIAVVMVGILCTAVVKSLFVLQVGPLRLRPALEGALTATLGFAAQALDLHPEMPRRRRAVAERLTALDPLIVAAANESAETAQQTQAVRLFVSVLVSIVTHASSVRDELATLPKEGVVASTVTPLRDMVRDLLCRVESIAHFVDADTGRSIAEARRTAAGMSAGLTLAIAPEVLDAIGLATRLEDLLEQLEMAREHLVAIEQGRSGRALTPVSYHRDAREAAIVGARAAIAAVLAGGFWIATAWSSGALMLAALLPACALLGTTERPDLASLGFARGMALASICAFFCVFFLLARVDGFPLMALTIAPFLIIACLFSTMPKHAASSTAFLIFFSVFLGLRNPMQYDMAAFLNTVFAMQLGTVFAVIAFLVLWPVNPVRGVRRLIGRLRADLVALAATGPIPAASVWESMMHDRLARLSTRLATSPDRAAMVEGGIAAIHIGRELVRARRLLGGLTLPPVTARTVETALRALRGPAVRFDVAAHAAHVAALRLLETAELDVMAADHAGLLRLAAAFHEIARLLTRHLGFFTGMPAMEPIAA